MRTLRSVVLPVVLVATLLPAGTASAAVSADEPVVTLSGLIYGAYEYRVFGHAKTAETHNRSEGRIVTSCDGSSPSGTDFVKDYASVRTDFVTPTAFVLLPEGYRCKVTVSWLIGGGGHVGETGVSPPTVIDTTPQRDNPRFTDDTKASARSLRDSARRVAAKNLALGSLPGLQPLIGISAIESVLGGVAAKVALDPPDPRYKTQVKRVRVAPQRIGAAEVGSAASAMNAYLAAAADATASGIAMTTAIDRAQGARGSKHRADRKRYDRAQMLSAAGFAKRLSGELKTLRARQKAGGSALRTCGCPLASATVTASSWTDMRDSLAINGAPAAYATELRRLRLPPALVKSAGLDLSAIDQLLPGTLPDELDNVQTLHTLDLMRAALSKWAKAVKRHPTATAPA